MSDQSVTAQTIALFDRIAQHFADSENYFLNALIVPDNDADRRVTIRRDAFSNDRLVLEIDMGTCEPCPVDPETGKTVYDERGCVVVAQTDRVGDTTAVVDESTRCQIGVEDSPRAFFLALQSVRDLISNDRDQPLYVVRQKRPDDAAAQSRTVLSQYGYPLRTALDEVDASVLSGELAVPAAAPIPVWQYAAIAIGGVLLLVLVAVIVAAILRRTCRSTKSAKMEARTEGETNGRSNTPPATARWSTTHFNRLF